MLRLLAASAAVLTVAACQANTPPAPAPPGAPATTTGLLPTGVPTEGVRPPADALPGAAEPQRGPAPSTPPPGQLVRVGDGAEGVTVDPVTRTVAVAVRNPFALVLLDADTDVIRGRTPLPGAVRHLQLAAPGGPVLVPVETANALIRVTLPGGVAQRPIVTGSTPHDASQAPNGTVFVGNEHGGTVTVLRGDAIVKVFTDSVQPAGLAPSGDRMGLLDVRKNDLTVYDADAFRILGSTPAGAGPTHLVADRHGRFIATDTRGDRVLVFDTSPRQVASIAQPGGPYGIAYDPTRDELWVASSGTNEVLGYSMADATPRLLTRIATVQDPYTVAVDPVSGKLFIASAAGGVLQIVDPGGR